MVSLNLYSGTDTGLVRENNQDSLAVHSWQDEAISMAMVADGVGGYTGGEIASRLAVDSILQQLEKRIQQARSGGGFGQHWMADVLRETVHYANQQILEQQHQSLDLKRMSTTLVMLLFKDDQFSLTHQGDSRCYRLRHSNLEQLTTDHTLAQEMLDEGAIDQRAFEHSPYHHVLSQGLGLADELGQTIHQEALQAGDLFLLCSDGLTNCVSDAVIQTVLNQSIEPQQMVDELIAQANDNGGIDNISVVLVEVDERL